MKYSIILFLCFIISCSSSAIRIESVQFIKRPYVEIVENEPVLHLNKSGTEGIYLDVRIEGTKVVIVATGMADVAPHRFKVKLSELNGKLKIMDSTELYRLASTRYVSFPISLTIILTSCLSSSQTEQRVNIDSALTIPKHLAVVYLNQFKLRSAEKFPNNYFKAEIGEYQVRFISKAMPISGQKRKFTLLTQEK